LRYRAAKCNYNTPGFLSANLNFGPACKAKIIDIKTAGRPTGLLGREVLFRQATEDEVVKKEKTFA
jgi:hypothetical protein